MNRPQLPPPTSFQQAATPPLLHLHPPSPPPPSHQRQTAGTPLLSPPLPPSHRQQQGLTCMRFSPDPRFTSATSADRSSGRVVSARIRSWRVQWGGGGFRVEGLGGVCMCACEKVELEGGCDGKGWREGAHEWGGTNWSKQVQTEAIYS